MIMLRWHNVNSCWFMGVSSALKKGQSVTLIDGLHEASFPYPDVCAVRVRLHLCVLLIKQSLFVRSKKLGWSRIWVVQDQSLIRQPSIGSAASQLAGRDPFGTRVQPKRRPFHRKEVRQRFNWSLVGWFTGVHRIPWWFRWEKIHGWFPLRSPEKIQLMFFSESTRRRVWFHRHRR